MLLPFGSWWQNIPFSQSIFPQKHKMFLGSCEQVFFFLNCIAKFTCGVTAEKKGSQNAEHLLHKPTCHRNFLGPFQVPASNSPDRATSLPHQHIHQLSTDLMDLHPILSCFRKPRWEENVCFLQPPSAFLFTFVSKSSQQNPPPFNDYLLLRRGNKKLFCCSYSLRYHTGCFTSSANTNKAMW